MTTLFASRASRSFEGIMAGDPVAICIAVAVVGFMAFGVYRKYRTMRAVGE